MSDTQGKASTRAKNKYREKAYDRVELVLPKGRKEAIQDAATRAGQSLNGYVTQAVDERIERDGAVEDNV